MSSLVDLHVPPPIIKKCKSWSSTADFEKDDVNYHYKYRYNLLYHKSRRLKKKMAEVLFLGELISIKADSATLLTDVKFGLPSARSDWL